jgi:hypothetical protein
MPAAGSCGLSDSSQCNQAWGGGKACNPTNFAWSQTADCNEHPCPVDCVVTQWGHWEPCSKGCDAGGTHRVRAIVSREEYGGALCPALRDPIAGLKPCNSHACSAHPASCGLEHVRCHVLMLEHHKSDISIRGDLNTCGHSAIEEQNMCWNNHSCKTCKAGFEQNSNTDHCNKEACHEADDAAQKGLHARLAAQFEACTSGADALEHEARRQAGQAARGCRKTFPTLQVTHDRSNMAQFGKFHCKKNSDNTCACMCDRHAPCCSKKNQLLTNDGVFGNRLTGVDAMQDCCNMCTNHPDCTAWEYTSEQVCTLKKGVVTAASFTPNAIPNVVTTWAGTPSGVGC